MMAPIEVLTNEKPWTVDWPRPHILSITWYPTESLPNEDPNQKEEKAALLSNQQLENEPLKSCPTTEQEEADEFQREMYPKSFVLLNRLSDLQTRDRPFVCLKCLQAFKRGHHLTRHKRTHTGERPFACDECENTYRRKTQLDRHRLAHTGRKPHRCRTCNKAFGRRYHLTRHIKLHAPKAKGNPKEAIPVSSS